VTVAGQPAPRGRSLNGCGVDVGRDAAGTVWLLLLDLCNAIGLSLEGQRARVHRLGTTWMQRFMVVGREGPSRLFIGAAHLDAFLSGVQAPHAVSAVARMREEAPRAIAAVLATETAPANDEWHEAEVVDDPPPFRVRPDEQAKKLRKLAWAQTVIFTVWENNLRREVFCLNIRSVAGWLFTLTWTWRSGPDSPCRETCAGPSPRPSRMGR
jgi:hypothetical protein